MCLWLVEQTPCPCQDCRQDPESKTDYECFKHDSLHVLVFNYNLFSHDISCQYLAQSVPVKKYSFPLVFCYLPIIGELEASCQLVTAPVEADETSRAYLDNTPRR